MIDKLKDKINEAIEKYGLNSDKVYKISLELDDEIAKHYKEKEQTKKQANKNNYIKSIERLKKYIQESSQIPTKEEWNKIAKTEGYLSSESMKYIGNIKFR